MITLFLISTLLNAIVITLIMFNIQKIIEGLEKHNDNNELNNIIRDMNLIKNSSLSSRLLTIIIYPWLQPVIIAIVLVSISYMATIIKKTFSK